MRGAVVRGRVAVCFVVALGLLAAVHLVTRRIGDGVRAEVQHRVRRAASDLDRPAVERQRVGADADAVGVGVRRLHGVDEPHDAPGAVAGRVVRLPRRRTDSQRELRRARHVHRAVEAHRDEDFLAQLERASVHQIHAVHGRRSLAAAVHLVVRRVGDGVGAEGQHRVRAILGPDRPAVEGQRIRADADAVGVGVRRLDFVEEEDGGRSGKGCHLPRRRPDRQRQLRPAGHVHRAIERHGDRDDLAQLVGAGAIRRAGDLHIADCRRGLRARRRAQKTRKQARADGEATMSAACHAFSQEAKHGMFSQGTKANKA